MACLSGMHKVRQVDRRMVARTESLEPSRGSNVILRRARPGLAGLRLYRELTEFVARTPGVTLSPKP